MVAVPERLQTLFSATRADLYGHPHYRGPAVDRPLGGSPITGGNAGEYVSATNGNNDGAGSNRAAVAAAVAAGGGTVHLYDGVSVLSNNISAGTDNMTYTGVERLSTLQNYGLYLGNSTNVIVHSLRIRGITGQRDNLQFNASISSGKVLYNWIHGYTVEFSWEADDALDMRIAGRQQDLTIGMVRFLRVPHSTIANTRCFLTWTSPTNFGPRPQDFHCWSHHVYYQGEIATGRAIDFRTPLHGGDGPCTGAKHYHSNCYHLWRQDGARARQGGILRSENCTYDPSRISGSNNYLDGQNSENNSPVLVVTPRLVNATDGNPYVNVQSGSVPTPASLNWDTYAVCPTSAAHDLEMQRLVGFQGCAAVLEGTAVGVAASELAGKYYDVVFPAGASALPTGSAFNAMRSEYIAGCRSTGGGLTGAQLFSGVGQIVRQSDNRVRCTIDLQPTLASNDEVYFVVPHDGAGADLYGTPVPATVLASGEPPPDPDPTEFVATIAADYSSVLQRSGGAYMSPAPDPDNIRIGTSSTAVLRGDWRFPTTFWAGDLASHTVRVSKVEWLITVNEVINAAAESWPIGPFDEDGLTDPEPLDAQTEFDAADVLSSAYVTTTALRTVGDKVIDITTPASIAHVEAAIAGQAPYSLAARQILESTYVARTRVNAHTLTPQPRLRVTYTLEPLTPPAGAPYPPGVGAYITTYSLLGRL